MVTQKNELSVTQIEKMVTQKNELSVTQIEKMVTQNQKKLLTKQKNRDIIKMPINLQTK